MNPRIAADVGPCRQRIPREPKLGEYLILTWLAWPTWGLGLFGQQGREHPAI